jgi:hypothetical protein
LRFLFFLFIFFFFFHSERQTTPHGVLHDFLLSRRQSLSRFERQGDQQRDVCCHAERQHKNQSGLGQIYQTGRAETGWNFLISFLSPLLADPCFFFFLFPLSEKNSILDRARKELEEYFEGKRQDFTIEIEPAGTEFQKVRKEKEKKVKILSSLSSLSFFFFFSSVCVGVCVQDSLWHDTFVCWCRKNDEKKILQPRHRVARLPVRK